MTPPIWLFADGPASRTRARRSLAGSAEEGLPVASTSASADYLNLQGAANSTVMSDTSGTTGDESLSQHREPAELVPSSPSSDGSYSEAMEMDIERPCPRVTIMDLPAEIIDHICNDVEDRQDLVSLCLVSMAFRDFGSRVLYREPKITSRHTAWKLRSATRSRRGLVNQIKVLDLDLINLCHASMWSSWHLQETGGVILDIMRYCHHLIHFRAQMLPEAAMFWQDFSSIIGSSFRYLQTLYKDVRHGHEPFYDFEHYATFPPAWISMPDLLTCINGAPHLHTLAVRGLGSALATRPHSFRTMQVPCRLRTLTIVQTSIKERDLLLLMGNASSVTKLTLIESTCISKRGLVDALSAAGSLLEDLTIGPGWWGKSDTSFPIDDLTPKLRNLRYLKVEGDIISPAFFGNTHSHAGHHVRLESLIVRRCHTFRPDLVIRAVRDMNRGVGLTAYGVKTNGGLGSGGANKRQLEQMPIKAFHMTHCSKNGWSLNDLKLLGKLMRPAELTNDFDSPEDDDED